MAKDAFHQTYLCRLTQRLNEAEIRCANWVREAEKSLGEKLNTQMYLKPTHQHAKWYANLHFSHITSQYTDSLNLLWTIHPLYEKPTFYFIGYSLNIDV